MSVAYVKIPWIKMGEMFLTVISFVQSGALILMSQAGSLYLNYVGYILYQTLFQVMIVVVTWVPLPFVIIVAIKWAIHELSTYLSLRP